MLAKETGYRIGRNTGVGTKTYKRAANEYQRSNTHHQYKKIEWVEIFFAMTIYILPCCFPRFDCQVFDEVQETFISMGKSMHQIVPDVTKAQPVSIGFLSAIRAEFLLWLQCGLAIKAVGWLHEHCFAC